MLMSLQKLSGVCVFMSQCKDIDLDFLRFTEKECKKSRGGVFPRSFMKRVKLVAESDLPNLCFVQQFIDVNSWHYNNYECWLGFAEVLRYRARRYGFSAIEDVAKEILIWWDYWDKFGFLSALDIILENKKEFIPVIKELIADIYFVRGIALTININRAEWLPLDYYDYINYDWMIQLLGILERIDATMTKEDHKNVDYIVDKLAKKKGKPLDDEDYKVFAELVGIDNEPNV